MNIEPTRRGRIDRTHWRSIYVKGPEGNIVELVCYDEPVGT